MRAWALRGGISSTMTAVDITTAAGGSRRVVVRQPSEWSLERNPDAAVDEFRLLRAVTAAGVRAPAPVALDASGEILPAPYLVLEHVDGEHRFDATDRDGYTRALAALLAAIHDLDLATLDLPLLPDLRDQFTRKLSRQPAALDASMDEARVRETLAAAWPLPERNAAVLLHGDLWPGNILWNGDAIAAALDWEDAGTGEPLIDLAIARLDATWVFGPDAADELANRYLARRPIDATDLAYWDLCAAFRSASNLAEWSTSWRELGRPDISERTMTEIRAGFVARALARLPA